MFTQVAADNTLSPLLASPAAAEYPAIKYVPLLMQRCDDDDLTVSRAGEQIRRELQAINLMNSA